jgi:cysteinyl-tRNA synthetase
LRMKEQTGDEPPHESYAGQVADARRRYVDAMDDDLNTSAALAAVFDFVRTTYQELDSNTITAGDARLALEFVKEVDAVFAVLRPEPQLVDDEIAGKIEERQAARRRRDFAEADRIRGWLLSQGIQLEDTREGVRWKRVR